LLTGKERPMRELQHLDWPFFDEHHRHLGRELEQWASAQRFHPHGQNDNVDATCKSLVRSLGQDGWIGYAVPSDYGGRLDAIDSRALCIIRETLAFHDGLADFAFAMQGLGSGALSLHGSEVQKHKYLPRVASGDTIAAFALSEPQAGSDVAAMTTSATREGHQYVLDGTKTWISNGGIADFYVVFARTDDTAKPSAGISAFLVEAGNPGLDARERIEVIAPHPLATLRLSSCRVPVSALIGPLHGGFAVAMQTLDIFRASVAAAALGFARRALAEALDHARRRKMFGQHLADFQLTQSALAEMATGIDAAALLTYRAAWLRDVRHTRTTREAAMAKMAATETAQRVIDRALQMFGGLGVKRGTIIESLYREIRALRIYEGATEVQQLIIGRDLVKHGA
jgi:acyl-CoA dehydrogenase